MGTDVTVIKNVKSWMSMLIAQQIIYLYGKEMQSSCATQITDQRPTMLLGSNPQSNCVQMQYGRIMVYDRKTPIKEKP